uniref:RING-type domain-containing protein n=1 Tax=Davidia involucrata TaxID=16924 RepID=A0A5B6ZI29_DAVIN
MEIPGIAVRERIGEMQGDMRDPIGERYSGTECPNPNTLLGERKEALENSEFLVRDRNGNGVRERKGRMESPNNLVTERREEVGTPDLVTERNEEIENPNDEVREAEMETTTGLILRETEREMDSPPIDDCCPICFGSFTIACKTSCGHWFCGNCILQYWNYSAALQRCKCPICMCLINKLTPEASLTLRQEEEVIEVLKNIKRYNRLFVGGAHGLILKVLQSPLVIRRMFQGLMDPDRFRFNYYIMRYFALLLSILYEINNFEFIPLAAVEQDVWGLEDCSIVVLLLW